MILYPEYNDLVLREDASNPDAPKVLSGTVVKYGDVARVKLKDGSVVNERFMPGSFTRSRKIEDLDILANIQHQRHRAVARNGQGLTLIDTPTHLRAEITLGEDSDSKDVYAKYKSGVLKGLSPEFDPVRATYENGVLSRHQAELSGIGIVDRPAFSESMLEERAAEHLSYAPPPVTERKFWL